MGWLPAWSVIIVGAGLGLALGAAMWRARLCTFGAIESALMAGDWRRMKIFALSLGIAVLLTQGLVAAAGFEPRNSTYIPSQVAIIPVAVGALMFGFGMALVGTCSFGSLVRLGGGDLRSLIVLIVFGALAYAMQRGVLAPVRLGLMETFAVSMPGGRASSLTHLFSYAVPTAPVLAASLCVAVALMAPALIDRRLVRAPRLMLAGAMLGAGVAAGWATTQLLVDPLDSTVRTQSLTFVAPVGRALFGALLNTLDWADFSLGAVFGVPVGALLAAWRAREFRWFAFDDDIEMRRHLAGAVLMGIGGVLAGGCTIGQGLSAGSVLAITWPIVVGGLMLGARLGIGHLVGENWRDILLRRGQ